MANANDDRRLYIGNIPYSADDAAFKDHLVNLGLAPRDCKVIMDRETGQARGFAFAEFDTVAAAQDAIGVITGSSMDGRVLRANVANPREDRGGGGGGGGRRFEDRGGRGRR